MATVRIPKEIYANYSRQIFGEPTMTPAQVVLALNFDNCVDAETGMVVRRPVWLTGANEFTALAAGVLYVLDYGAATFGHRSLFVA